MGSRDSRIQAKKRWESVKTFENKKSKLMASRDRLIQAKQTQNSVTAL